MSESDDDGSLGEQVKSARERKGMSQTDLAEHMARRGHEAWRQTTVSRTERGARRLVVNELRTLEEVLGCSLYRGGALTIAVTLDEFLLARIAEDEAAARAVPPLGHIADMGVVRFGPTRRHFARWDPARVLAECDAKRRIVESYQRALAAVEAGEWSVADHHTLRLLALPYAEHRDYRPEWAPEVRR